MNETEIKVGDELAFHGGYGHGKWSIHKVDRITPSGRIVCGPYTLNPNLRVRGRRGYGGPWEGERVTAKIREDVRRRKLLETIDDVKWGSLDTDTLAKVNALVASAADGGGE